MQVAIPHQLGREEARRRLKANSGSLGQQFPAGMATVQTSWPSEDRMALAIGAMGQNITGHIDVADTQVLLTVDLPLALGFIEPLLTGAIQDAGRKMLAPPKP